MGCLCLRRHLNVLRIYILLAHEQSRFDILQFARKEVQVRYLKKERAEKQVDDEHHSVAQECGADEADRDLDTRT